MRKKEERIMKEQRRQAEKIYYKSDAQMRLEDPDIPEMELFKIDYGNVQIPKKKKLVVKTVEAMEEAVGPTRFALYRMP